MSQVGPESFRIDLDEAQGTLNYNAQQDLARLMPRLGFRCRSVAMLDGIVTRVVGDTAGLKLDNGREMSVARSYLYSIVA